MVAASEERVDVCMEPAAPVGSPSNEAYDYHLERSFFFLSCLFREKRESHFNHVTLY